jgi:hypothetical protein
MIPLLHHLYPWVRYYRCGLLQGRDAEDCWQVGALSVTFRPVWLWWWAQECHEVGWDDWGREWWVNTPWVSVLWMPEGEQ